MKKILPGLLIPLAVMAVGISITCYNKRTGKTMPVDHEKNAEVHQQEKFNRNTGQLHYSGTNVYRQKFSLKV